MIHRVTGKKARIPSSSNVFGHVGFVTKLSSTPSLHAVRWSGGTSYAGDYIFILLFVCLLYLCQLGLYATWEHMSQWLWSHNRMQYIMCIYVVHEKSCFEGTDKFAPAWVPLDSVHYFCVPAHTSQSLTACRWWFAIHRIWLDCFMEWHRLCITIWGFCCRVGYSLRPWLA